MHQGHVNVGLCSPLDVTVTGQDRKYIYPADNFESQIRYIPG